MMGKDQDILARTLWGEARGEGMAGMEAVACVIMNRFDVSRAHPGFWWGQTIAEICQKPFQFSCWNKNDPNRGKMLLLTPDDFIFKHALEIAEAAMRRQIRDKTRGATHYRNKSVDPTWDDGEKPTAIIGKHFFYRPKEVPGIVKTPA